MNNEADLLELEVGRIVHLRHAGARPDVAA